jgi:hypothetical protein
MTRCEVQAAGGIELYFYDELGAAERASVEAHVRGCAECANALEELRVIRDALASRPDVAAPPSGDWSAFMGRLDAALRPGDTGSMLRADDASPRGRYIAYLAMAALLALVTFSVALALRVRHAPPAQTSASTTRTVQPKADAVDLEPAPRPDVAFEALSEEHFERSKLVVLGLATKGPADRRPSDWAYERELASALLNDTRMYRLAAEDRGLTDIAGVMRDLEVVLLQTSLTDEKDPSALPQIQRLIRKRDLLEKMDAVAVPSADRKTGTKGI